VEGKVKSYPPNATTSAPSFISFSALLFSLTTSGSVVLRSTPPNTPNINKNKSVVIGGVIGGVGGALALIFGLAWFLMRRLRRRGDTLATKEDKFAPSQTEQMTYEVGIPPQEIGGSSTAELAAESQTRGRARRELLA
jgi:hypothetical protein